MKTLDVRKPLMVILLVLLVSITACGGGGANPRATNPAPAPSPAPSSIATKYQGKWLAEGYGRFIEIGSSSFRLLDFTSGFCLESVNEEDVDTDDVEGSFRLNGNDLELFADVGTETFGAPAVRFRNVSSLPESCEQGLSPSIGDPGYERDPRRELRLFAELIAEYSVYPQLRDIDALDLLEQQLLHIDLESSDEELAEALFRIAEPFADIHTTVSTNVGLVKVLNKPSLPQILVNEWLITEEVSPPLSPEEIDAVNAYVSQQASLDRAITLAYAEDEASIKSAANDLITWFAADGIGYLAIDAMLGFGDSEDNDDELSQLNRALDQALQDLQDVDPLIVDIRRNGGGKDFLSLAIAGRFAANQTLAYSKQARVGDSRDAAREVYVSPEGEFQYLGNVVLLTSAETASGAEVFALAMRELANVTVMGEATQGGLSDQLDKRLTNGWSASVANEFYLSAGGEWFEGLGIPVDIEVPQFTKEARDAGVDLAIETLLLLLEE